jgi:hypothetical protein
MKDKAHWARFAEEWIARRVRRVMTPFGCTGEHLLGLQVQEPQSPGKLCGRAGRGGACDHLIT